MKKITMDKTKELLTSLAIDEILKKKVVRGGKIKKVRKSSNVAQANKLSGSTPQKRRKASVKRLKTVKKKGGVKAKQKRKQKRSSKISKRAGIGRR